jgi:PLP dependent protein
MTLAERLDQVRERIAGACARAGREPGEITIVVVTKTHPPETAQSLVDAGVADLGENRVQELVRKSARVEGASWHYVGRLQRNKAPQVVGLAALVHSVDRRGLVDRIEREATAPQRVLVQVNVGDDPRKGGCSFDEALALVGYARERRGLVVEGFMTIPPMPPNGADAAEHARPCFARLRDLRDAARERWPEVKDLSMGMSADFESAVEEGATILRLGTVVLGPRLDPPWQPEPNARTERGR